MKEYFKVSFFAWEARKDQQGKIPVYIRSKQNSTKAISYNTGVKVFSNDLTQKKKGKPRTLKNKPAKLIELEGKLQSTYVDLFRQGYEPDLKQLLKHLNDKHKPTNNSVVAWCNDYQNGQYSEGQKKAVRTLKSNVEDFNAGLTFDKLTKPRLKSFFEHLTKHGVANNSQYKRLRALVNVANHANIDCPALMNYELPYSTVNALKTRLTWAEVKKVMTTETENNLEAVAKDVFLLSCFSGLRIGDILSLNKGELFDYHYERLQTKTKKPVLVTIHKYNHDLFAKFIKSGVPYVRQTLSGALKDVLERSGMTKEVVRVQAVGYRHKETVTAKFQEVSFHSGRRFFSRLLNDLGLGGEISRDELGHGFKSITDLYAGSPEHSYRVARVRKAMETLEQTLEQLALMKVA